MRICDLKLVIESYLFAHLVEGRDKGKELLDFLPTIGPNCEYILDSWMKHFKERQIPYCVTQISNIKTLWIIKPPQITDKKEWNYHK